MAENEHIPCPKCGRSVRVAGDWLSQARCVGCAWTGQAVLMNPLPLPVDRPVEAGADDATCVHHPTKQATAVCAGTGDLICPLCSYRIADQVYSVQYLEGAGQDLMTARLQRDLKRPDIASRTCLLLGVLSLLTCVGAPLASVLAVVGLLYEYRAHRQSKSEHGLFPLVYDPHRAIGRRLLLVLMFLVSLGLSLAMIVQLMQN